MWHSRHSMVRVGSPGWFQWLLRQLSYWFCSCTQPTWLTSSSMNCLWQAAQYSGVLNRRLREVVDVLRGIGADQEVARRACRGAVLRVLEQVPLRLRHHVVGVALDVGLADRVAGEAGDALLVAGAGSVRSSAKMFLVPENSEIGSWQPPQ